MWWFVMTRAVIEMLWKKEGTMMVAPRNNRMAIPMLLNTIICKV